VRKDMAWPVAGALSNAHNNAQTAEMPPMMRTANSMQCHGMRQDVCARRLVS